MIVDWQKIDTVMLDMDGTILDLHYDNYFWQTWLPTIYAEKHDLTFNQSLDYLQPIFKAQEGTLNWYCIDYWSDVLNIDIAQEKRREEVARKIRFRDGAEAFLLMLKNKNINTWLVTNAHPTVLEIKSSVLPIGKYFDKQLSSHSFGHPKEHQEFWQGLQEAHSFVPERSLFIDDSHSVLYSARKYGISNLFAIEKPDSTQGAIFSEEFNVIRHFQNLL